MKIIVAGQSGVCKHVAIEKDAVLGKFGKAVKLSERKAMRMFWGGATRQERAARNKVYVTYNSGELDCYRLEEIANDGDAAGARVVDDGDSGGDGGGGGGTGKSLAASTAVTNATLEYSLTMSGDGGDGGGELGRGIVGAHCFEKHVHSNGLRSMLMCDERGNVEFRYVADGEGEEESTLYHSVALDTTTLGAGAGERNGYKATENIARCRVEAMAQRTLLYGGRENNVRIFDIESGKTAWRGKNVKNDMLRMSPPVWVTDLHFKPGSDVEIYQCTGYGEIRFFDTRVQRKPLANFAVTVTKDKFEESKRFVCMAVASTDHPVAAMYEHRMWCGDVYGNIFCLDRRMTTRPLYKYLGTRGSIRAIDVHPTLPVLCSVGLDRHAYVHHAESRKLEHNLYLKQRLIGVLFGDEERVEHKTAEDIAAERAVAKADEDEALWAALQRDEEERNEREKARRKAKREKRAKQRKLEAMVANGEGSGGSDADGDGDDGDGDGGDGRVSDDDLAEIAVLPASGGLAGAKQKRKRWKEKGGVSIDSDAKQRKLGGTKKQEKADKKERAGGGGGGGGGVVTAAKSGSKRKRAAKKRR